MSSSSHKGKPRDARAKAAAAAGKPVAAAPLSRRLIAFLIDWYLGALVVSLPVAAVAAQAGLDMMNQDITSFPGTMGITAGAAALAAGALYYVLVPMLWDGRTVGKRVMGLRIVSRDGAEASAGSMLVRQVLGLIVLENALLGCGTVLRQLISMGAGPLASTVALWIGFVAAIACGILLVARPDRRCLHDLMAGTKVIAG